MQQFDFDENDTDITTKHEWTLEWDIRKKHVANTRGGFLSMLNFIIESNDEYKIPHTGVIFRVFFPKFWILDIF